MKLTILPLALSLLVLASCSTAYKTGQTPDDVYYSAAKPENKSDDKIEKEEREYTYDDQYYDDRYLRMKVRNRYRWNDLDDWYSTDRYSIGYNYYFASFNNPFNRWNYYYNPYCCCLNNYNYVFVNPKTPASPPVVKRNFSLGGYTNTGTNNNNNPGMPKTNRTTTKPVYNNTNNNSNNGLSNKIRTIFSNDNSGSGSGRTYNPSTSSGSSGNNGSRSSSGSGSSGGSSGGGVKRPTRN